MAQQEGEVLLLTAVTKVQDGHLMLSIVAFLSFRIKAKLLRDNFELMTTIND